MPLIDPAMGADPLHTAVFTAICNDLPEITAELLRGGSFDATGWNWTPNGQFGYRFLGPQGELVRSMEFTSCNDAIAGLSRAVCRLYPTSAYTEGQQAPTPAT